jgi:photosystem II stability/assembly factor-like uncharacterized protein
MKSSRWATALAAGVAAAAAIAPAAASANVQVGSSGWQWGNPQPQGNTINSITFAGGTGYAAGDFGTLLKTVDGGGTWTGLPTGTFENLSFVQAIDANTIFAGGGCVARRSLDGGATFTRIAFSPVESTCPQPLAGLSFVDKNTGWLMLADGSVTKTTDGGLTFSPQNPVPGTKAATGGTGSPTAIQFLDATTGFAANTLGQIFKTTDGGATWTKVSETDRGIAGLTFASPTIAYAVGKAGLFLKSADGGATWLPIDIGAGNEDLTSVRCSSPLLCIITTAKGDKLIRTGDGGATSSQVTPPGGAIYAAGFASDTQAAALGLSGATAISVDGGQNFSQVGGSLLGTYTGIRAGAQAGTAFAVGNDGALAKTTDGGKTWVRGNVATPVDVSDVSFPTAQLGYALDSGGSVFKTANGGSSWAPLDTGSTAKPNRIFATGSSTVMTIGGRGIRRSTDSGGTWSQVKGKAVAKTSLFGVDRAGTSVFAWGALNVIRSTDGGKTWAAVTKPGPKTRNHLRIDQVDFVSAKAGFLLDDDGRVWSTANGGKSWKALTGVGDNRIDGMAFASAKSGYLVLPQFGESDVSAGYLLRTTDGGATWHPQFVVNKPIASGGIAAGGNGTDYLLGGDSGLLASTTGGDAGAASNLTITTKHTKLKKAGKITVTGKLSPASGGEQVVVSFQKPGSTRWSHTTAKVAANGSFTTTWSVPRGASSFVAQWTGNYKAHGDGSKVLSVKVGK